MKGKKRLLAMLFAVALMFSELGSSVAQAVENAGVESTADGVDEEAVIVNAAGEETVSADVADAVAEPVEMGDGEAVNEARVIYSGTYLGMEWTIDSDRVLTISGNYDENAAGTGNSGKTGNDMSTSGDTPMPWGKNYKSAKVTAKGVKSTEFWFMNSTVETLDFSEFDTSEVTNMRGMFEGCSALQSLDMSKLDTGNVTDMSRMFFACKKLTELDISALNTEKVTDMSFMFQECSLLTNLNVKNINTKNVTNMANMFSGLSKLEKLDISDFDTSKVTDMSMMFSENSGLVELDISNFDVSKVTDMSMMFYNCVSLKKLNLGEFCTDNATQMGGMFHECRSLTELDVSSFDTGNVTDMNDMFYNCSRLETLDVANFNTSNVTNMSMMFEGCSALTSLDVSKFDTSKATKLNTMFGDCSGLTDLDVGNFNTATATDIAGMFSGCSKLTSLDVSRFDISNAQNVRGLFMGCSGLKYIDVSNFKTDKITSLRYMFAGCSSLTKLDLSNFDTSLVTDTDSMFSGCTALKELNLGNFDAGKLENVANMFTRCNALSAVKVMKNLAMDISLPVSPMYDAEGGSYSAFPKELTDSIWLVTDASNFPPDVVHNVAEVEEIQSTHPYENNTNESWIYKVTGAEKLNVTFDENTLVEQDKDYIYLYDVAGTQIGKYTGTELAGKSIEVAGNTVEIRLYADDAGTEYGFKVNTVTATVPLKRISLNETKLSMAVGEKTTFTVIFYPQNTTSDKAVMWKSSDETVLKISESGEATAISEGTSIVMAVVGELEASCKIIVAPSVTGVTLDQNQITLQTGQTQKLAYTLAPAGATAKSLQVSSSDDAIASASVDEKQGQIEVKALKAGTAVITVKADGFSAQCTVTVTQADVPVTALKLNLSTVMIPKNQSLTLTATVTPADATNQKIKWSSSNDKIATVSENGVIAGISAGSCTITAEAMDGSGVKVSCAVTVKDDEKEKVESTTVFVVKQKVDVTQFFKTTYDKYVVDDKSIASVTKKGVLTGKKPGTVQVTGYVKDGKQWKETETVILTIEKPVITEKTITKTRPDSTFDGDDNITGTTVKPTSWISSKPAVATVDTSTGRITTVGKGSAKITAVYGEGKQAAKYTFTVKVAIPVMSKKTAKVMTGATLNLKLKNTKLTPAWTSSAPKVASVDNGKVTIHTVGTATITATVDGVGYTCEITVTEPQLKKEAVTIKTGKSAKLGWKNTKLKGDSITWTSSNPKVATVDSTGKVTAVSEGTAVITSKVGGVTGTCTVTVQ